MVNTTPEWYLFNLFLTFIAFYLFVILISIFGLIFFRFLRKVNKNEWGLHFLEVFIISFAIGLSIYIILCLILDIFMFFNFYSAYLSIIVIDSAFILFLIYRKKLTREQVSYFISKIKKRFKTNPKDSFVFIGMIALVFVIQIMVQWRVITQDFTLPAKDTWGSIGHMWHLLDKGYLWRERHSIHYPRAFHFFIAAPVLINPDFRFAYLYYKFAGIPLLSFYLFVMAVILKKFFKKNYLVLAGLMLTLISNQILSRYCVLTSTLIPTLMILISIIIITSKCPFYLTGFLVQVMFLFNPAIANCYLPVWGVLILYKIISKNYRTRAVLLNDFLKPLILIFVLLVAHFVHTFIVLNISLYEFLNSYGGFLGPLDTSITSNFLFLKTLSFNRDFQINLNTLIFFDIVISSFKDFEVRLLSFFLIFTFIGLFLPTNKYFAKKYHNMINFTKIALITLIWYYIAEIFFSKSHFFVLFYFWWIKSRAVEALSGPLIILCCFILEIIIKKASIFTIYLKNRNSSYRNLLRKTVFGKFLRIENIIITVLLISVFSTFIVHRDVPYNLEFEEDHVETMFYIKDNIREDSKILVNFYDGTGDALTSLLSTYKVYDWEFDKGKNDIIDIKQYIVDKDIEYVLLDLDTVNSTELFCFTSDVSYENIYENEENLLFKYDYHYTVL